MPLSVTVAFSGTRAGPVTVGRAIHQVDLKMIRDPSPVSRAEPDAPSTYRSVIRPPQAPPPVRVTTRSAVGVPTCG